MNRKQRRAATKRPGENYAGFLQRQKAAVSREMLQEHGADAIQRYMWLTCVALNQEFGFGKFRWRQFLAALQEVSDEFTEMMDASGAEYAVEKLRQRVAQISEMEVEANADLRKRGAEGRRVL